MNPPIDRIDTTLAAYKPRVKRLVRRMRHAGLLVPHLETDDLVSEALIAVWRALETYDPARNDSRDAYIFTQARRRLIDYQRAVTRANGWTRRCGQIAELYSLNKPIETHDTGHETYADAIPGPHELSDHVEARIRLRTLLNGIDKLNQRDQACVRALTGGHSNTALAQSLGISPSRVTQLMHRLPHQLDNAGLAA